ncbi:hypothetical protein E0493_22180 [Roseomonas sp. M0104]|uniref:Uncharacterized protein n=1 Tax=Teichococcus coralli TaxID=2545983 RepID=A0A845BIR2_9PROT|nr:hypothetical protein [Pseudoroseomonas coralli]MXP66056.1 hypothetical protein [Pseudoroseomonas coralli]
MTDTAASDFSAESIRNLLGRKRQEKEEERRLYEAKMKAERDKLRAAFMEREVQPEAIERVAAVVWKAIEAGDKEALLFRFPSDWLPDQGRSITNHESNWHAHLDGFAKRAYDYYERELEPRGFQLRVQILDWPGGMPGDVGFFIQWKHSEEL